MTILNATQVKATLENGDKPTGSDFSNMIDSVMRPVLMAIASGAENGSTGILNVTASNAVSFVTLGAVGNQIITASTTASAVGAIGAGTFGTALLATSTTADARNLLNIGAAGTATSTLNDLTDVSAPSPTSGAALRFLGGEWVASTVPDNAWSATQAQMVGASAANVVVTPAIMQYHPGAAKAWVNFSGTAASINASYNVTSITKNGTGDYTVNFTQGFANTNYAVAGTVSIGSAAATTGNILVVSQAVGNSRIQVFDKNGLINRNIVCVSFLGTQ